MKQRQGPAQQPEQAPGAPTAQSAPEPADGDQQELYGNAFCADLVEAGNDPPGAAGGRGRRSGQTPQEVFFIQWHDRNAVGAQAAMGVGPEPEDTYDALYEGVQLHEAFTTPAPLQGHFPAAALNPALASEHGGTVASAASRMRLGDTSLTFTVDDADSFDDHHYGFGIPNPEWILPEYFAQGIGWTVDQWYTHNGRRLRGTFTINRICTFDGTNLRVDVTKE